MVVSTKHKKKQKKIIKFLKTTRNTEGEDSSSFLKEKLARYYGLVVQ